MAAYRVYTASFAFEAREASELSIEEGDTVVVYERSDSSDWPDPAKWMKGTNKRTGSTGDFPGTYCTFVEEVVPAPPPPPVAERSPAPQPLPAAPVEENAPPVPPRRQGKTTLGKSGVREREGERRRKSKRGYVFDAL